MDKIIVSGGNALKGIVKVEGAKNAVLPILAASLLASNKKTVLREAQALLENNEITYLNNRILTTLDIKKQKVKRVTEEFDLIIDFKNELIITKYLECSLDLNIKIIDKQIEQNRIYVKYEVIDSKDIFEYEITWRKI